MFTKSQLKDIFTRHAFRPVKRFGENYLIDANIKNKIIGAIGPAKGDTVLEIGPGFGAITMDLAGSEADVFAVEKDPKAYAILSGIVGRSCPNLRLFCADILKFELKDIFSGKKIKVAGNLPYYITTPILEYLISNRCFLDSAVLMVQKEVAHRLGASPGNKDYGSISCFVQYHARETSIYTVRRSCFFPPPEVDSVLLKLDFLETPAVSVNDEELFFKILRGAFNQRRKSILNSLSRESVLDMPKDDLGPLLKSCGIDPSARPEVLSLSDFARISNKVV